MNDELQSIISQSREESNGILTAIDDGVDETKDKRMEKKRRRG